MYHTNLDIIRAAKWIKHLYCSSGRFRVRNGL